MNQKLFEELRVKFDYMPDGELQAIWRENDRGVYSVNELEAVRQILRVRQAEVPEQAAFEGSSDEVTSVDEVNGLLRGAMVFLAVFGVLNVVYWYFGGGTERALVVSRFGELKPLMVVMLYGQAVLGGMLIFMGLLCLLQRDNVMILLFSGMVLVFSGLWNLFSNLLAIPAFAEYGVVLTFFKAYDDFKYVLFVLGVLEVRWGYNQLRDFFRVRKFERENSSSVRGFNSPR